MREFKNILVTGGAGFIGSAFVRWAVGAHPEWKIRVLDKLTYAGNRANLSAVSECIDFIEGDIFNGFDVVRAMDGIDAVVHFAAESHVDRSLVNPNTFVITNVNGTCTLLAAAQKAGVKRFLHVSTDEVYGDIPHHGGPVSSEYDRLNPSSPYAASKAAAEQFVLAYRKTYGMDTVITRGSNTYGSHQYPEKIIPLFTVNAIMGKPLPLYGNGMALRDYMHVQDHVLGIAAALLHGQPGGVYNLGAELSITGVKVAESILDILGKPHCMMRFVEDRLGHDLRYAMDCERAMRELDWQPLWSFADGLQQTVRWYTDNEYWWRPLVEG